MRLPVRLTMLFLALTIISLMVVFQVSAQPPSDNSGVTEETSVSDETATDAQSGIVLPEDIPTRESFEPETDNNPAVGPTVGDYVRVFAGLIIVIVVIWGLSLLLKKFVTVRGLASSSESLKILSTLSLSPSRVLYLVRLGDRILLIGGGEGGLRTLADITNPEEVSQIMRELEFKGNFDLNPFKSRLDSIMGEDDKVPAVEEDFGSRQRKLQGMLDRLKDTKNSDSK
ncbi:MAG: flagellar biosynthetic protein FliO [bacterium]|nr:flagellar biosynthetic protein FliO [bacterium]